MDSQYKNYIGEQRGKDGYSIKEMRDIFHGRLAVCFLAARACCTRTIKENVGRSLERSKHIQSGTAVSLLGLSYNCFFGTCIAIRLVAGLLPSLASVVL